MFHLQHSPGALTDLRSALVNNTFFAQLAIKYNFHKYMHLLSFELYKVINNFAKKRIDNREKARQNVAGDGHEVMDIDEDHTLFVGEDDCENFEDIEVPKALGDIFESVAGAIYLDSGMSLDAVWKVFYRMFRPELSKWSTT